MAAMTSGAQGSMAELFTRAGGGSALGGLAREAGEAGPAAAAGPAWSGEADLTAEAGSESGLGEASSEPGESGPAQAAPRIRCGSSMPRSLPAMPVKPL